MEKTPHKSKPIIEVKHLGKKYNITHFKGGYLSLRDVLATIFRNPFRFLGGKIKSAVGLQKQEEFWALRDVSFSIRPGEVVGIIGSNGAGKSTLLKILTGITPPTEGEVVISGRVGSLLEVGTGFHPELTGRENIFLNGAILGMKKREIQKKFDEIVAFAGIEKFLDTPVKRYSSGMYVRLAFSVAAHMDTEILLIDEVLAVGDADFQKKCLGKMEDITRGQGRTIIFVSHNLAAVSQLCQKTILLEQGKVADIGNTNEVIERYLKSNKGLGQVEFSGRKEGRISKKLLVTDVRLRNSAGERVDSLVAGEDCSIELAYDLHDRSLREVDLDISINSIDTQSRIAFLATKTLGKKISVKEGGVLRMNILRLPLNIAEYQINIFVKENLDIVDWVHGILGFRVQFGDFYHSGQLPPIEYGNTLLDYHIA